MTWFLIGLAIVWTVPIVVSIVVIVRTTREVKADDRMMAQERRMEAVAVAAHSLDAQRSNPRRLGRIDGTRRSG